MVFYICCLMWFFWLKRSDHPIFFLTLEITKITKMTVLSVDKMALECTRRPGTVWFMHCIFVISVVVGLIRACQYTELTKIKDCFSAHNYSHWSYEFWIFHNVLELIEKECNKNLTRSSLFSQCSDGKRNIIL